MPAIGYLTADGVDTDHESPMNQLLGSSITYRIAVGPQQGRKVFTLQTLPDCRADNPCAHTAGKVAGFSLHAGVAARAHERDKLERLRRYIARPAVATKRLSLTRHGKVRYELKTASNDGTTHVLFEPLDFIARLAALVPKPRVNLIRFHGVFAPNRRYRAQVTPAKRGKGRKAKWTKQAQDQAPAEKRASMTWAGNTPIISHCGFNRSTQHTMNTLFSGELPRFFPHSGYTIGLIFSDAYSCFRPKTDINSTLGVAMR